MESISRELGYCSVFDFSAKFKSYTGLSPSEFRRKAQAPYRDFFHTPLNLIK
ncbi:AraC family transcriptional regulator [Victivallis lenta]|uniref:AraC family transcriptional regulator n=1 Tax=Victivallis lenta TaxID=2606640 RepID=UPI003C6FFC78